jgi:hypothetical protein
MWVCEPDNPDPQALCQMLVGGVVYQGRYHIDDGKRAIWCRGSSVSISNEEPRAENGGPWSLAGCIDFDSDGDYDVYVKPGNECQIKIELVVESGEGPCD